MSTGATPTTNAIVNCAENSVNGNIEINANGDNTVINCSRNTVSETGNVKIHASCNSKISACGSVITGGSQCIIAGNSIDAKKQAQEAMERLKKQREIRMNASNSIVKEGGQQTVSVNNNNSTIDSIADASNSKVEKGASQCVSINVSSDSKNPCIADASGSILGEGAQQFVGVNTSEEVFKQIDKFMDDELKNMLRARGSRK